MGPGWDGCFTRRPGANVTDGGRTNGSRRGVVDALGRQVKDMNGACYVRHAITRQHIISYASLTMGCLVRRGGGARLTTFLTNAQCATDQPLLSGGLPPSRIRDRPGVKTASGPGRPGTIAGPSCPCISFQVHYDRLRWSGEGLARPFSLYSGPLPRRCAHCVGFERPALPIFLAGAQLLGLCGSHSRCPMYLLHLGRHCWDLMGWMSY